MYANPKIIAQFKVKKEIIPAAEIQRRSAFLADYLRANPYLNGFAIGISGGIDSAVAAAIAKIAADSCNKSIYAVLTPYHDTDFYLPYAFEFVESMNMTACIRDIGNTIDTACRDYGIPQIDRIRMGNRKIRQRMIEWYDIAHEKGLIVVGTEHATESIVGYCTKHGDSAYDIAPLKTLDKRQIYQIAEELNIPENIRKRKPSADYWEGQTDEDELGLLYDDICDYLEGKEITTEVNNKIESLYYRSMHKRKSAYI